MTSFCALPAFSAVGLCFLGSVPTLLSMHFEDTVGPLLKDTSEIRAPG